MKEKSKIITIPIYGTELEMVITDDMIASQKKEPRFTKLGKLEPWDAIGLVCHNGPKMAVFFDVSHIDHNLIGHEVFHVVHRIGERVGVRVGRSHHEALAYLQGFISEQVYDFIIRSKWKTGKKSKI